MEISILFAIFIFILAIPSNFHCLEIESFGFLYNPVLDEVTPFQPNIMVSKYEGHFNDTYSGSSEEDLDLFLQRFELNSQLRDFANEKKHLVLSLRLRGNAAIWLSTLEDSKKDTFAHLKAALISNFKDDNLKWVNESKLSARFQEESEHLDNYFLDISTLCHKLNKSDQEKLTHFIRGLRPQLRAFVISKEPESLERALHFARLAQTVTELPSPSANQVSTLPNCNSPEVEQMPSVAAVDKLSEQIAQISTKVDKIATRSKTRPQQTTNRPFQQRQFGQNRYPSFQRSYRANGLPFNPNRPTCFRCGKPGHKKFDCYSKFHIEGYPLN